MSEYAVHFTKPAPGASAYEVMRKILWEGRINLGAPQGAARGLVRLGDSQRPACFSEIPLDMLARLVDRRSQYGIGFHQRFLIDSGGARVWYLDKDGRVAAAFQAVVSAAWEGGIQPTDPIWTVTPFVDFPGEYGPTRYRFEWEREWRVPGGLSFRPEDVAFLFIPEGLHEQATTFFEAADRDGTGPAYFVPYIDPSWEMNRIQAAFAGVATPPADSCDFCGGPAPDGRCIVCGNGSLHRP
jgi:hypothetical protein